MSEINKTTPKDNRTIRWRLWGPAIGCITLVAVLVVLLCAYFAADYFSTNSKKIATIDESWRSDHSAPAEHPNPTEGSDRSTGGALPLSAPIGEDKLDVAVTLVLGRTSSTYAVRGYKEMLFGTAMEEIEQSTPLYFQKTTPYNLFRNREYKEDSPDEKLLFSTEKKLIGYAKRNVGGPEDYAEQIRARFGGTQKDLKKRQSQNLQLVSVDYTFAKVLVNVTFISIGDSFGKKNYTWVGVIDRTWATAILQRSAADVRRNLDWVKAASVMIANGDMDITKIRPLPGTELRATSEKFLSVDYPVAELVDAETEKAKAIATIETAHISSESGRGLVKLPTIFFAFNRYAQNVTPQLYMQPDSRSPEYKSGVALVYTPFSHLVTELDLVLLQEYFPPKTDKISYKQYPNRPDIYEWRTAENWLVQLTSDRTVYLEKLEEKGL